MAKISLVNWLSPSRKMAESKAKS
jgi:hypothetical protein